MKRFISFVITAVMLLTMTIGINITAYATDYTNTATPVKANTLTMGDTFQMGVYPQSEITDGATINALDAITCTMESYGYMQNAKADTHTYAEVDMHYADIAYNGNLYRKVTINAYRPSWTKDASSADNTYQDENGYEIGNTYYFKWEPIVWQVLAKETDGVYVMSQSLLDSQAYHNYYETTTWETSSLRTWLNEDFYHVAFSENEQSKIETITHSNENNPSNNDARGGNDTTDTVWVLSYSDAINTAYSFNDVSGENDTARQAKGSDYAQIQGLCVSSNEYSYWWLRTPGRYENRACALHHYGYTDHYSSVSITSRGVRPALKINLTSEIFKSDAATGGTRHIWASSWSKDADNHWHACQKCGEIKDKAAHIWNAGVETTPASETAEGVKTYTCTVCGKTKTEAIAKLPAQTQDNQQENAQQQDASSNQGNQQTFNQPTDEISVPPTASAITAKKVKLSLKKVAVKKNAKKLVLKATLKINGKAVKGKKVTFTFNGKKYTAKTNKKGVAKVTVKKSVLKKLKKGKKITYSVKYGKKTVKKTAKVK